MSKEARLEAAFTANPDPNPSSWSQDSLVSNASDGGTRHLALVFFDLLMLDGVSFLDEPYRTRRAILERTVRTRAGYVMLAARARIPPPEQHHASVGDDATSTLRKIMAAHISNHEEGVVLKAEESTYNNWRMPWVKVWAKNQ